MLALQNCPAELEELPTLGRDAVQLPKTDINDILLSQPGITVNPDALVGINIIFSTLDPQFSRNSGGDPQPGRATQLAGEFYF
jgi:hypothetical protein